MINSNFINKDPNLLEELSKSAVVLESNFQGLTADVIRIVLALLNYRDVQAVALTCKDLSNRTIGLEMMINKKRQLDHFIGGLIEQLDENCDQRKELEVIKSSKTFDATNFKTIEASVMHIRSEIVDVLIKLDKTPLTSLQEIDAPEWFKNVLEVAQMFKQKGDRKWFTLRLLCVNARRLRRLDRAVDLISYFPPDQVKSDQDFFRDSLSKDCLSNHRIESAVTLAKSISNKSTRDHALQRIRKDVNREWHYMVM